MMQSERDWLFKVSYGLDNRKRIKGLNGQLLVMFTHEELEIIAADLRKLAEIDGTRFVENIKTNGARRGR
jgi:uncharacterized ferredoxin-like protein